MITVLHFLIPLESRENEEYSCGLLVLTDYNRLLLVVNLLTAEFNSI